MSDTGTIKADGTIVLDGYTPSKTVLVGITFKLIAIKHPGGSYSDPGGQHYVSACIEVAEIETLTPANAENEYRFSIKRMGMRMSFHPTPKTAQQEAAKDVKDVKDVARYLEKQRSHKSAFETAGANYDD